MALASQRTMNGFVVVGEPQRSNQWIMPVCVSSGIALLRVGPAPIG